MSVNRGKRNGVKDVSPLDKYASWPLQLLMWVIDRCMSIHHQESVHYPTAFNVCVSTTLEKCHIQEDAKSGSQKGWSGCDEIIWNTRWVGLYSGQCCDCDRLLWARWPISGLDSDNHTLILTTVCVHMSCHHWWHWPIMLLFWPIILFSYSLLPSLLFFQPSPIIPDYSTSHIIVSWKCIVVLQHDR